MPVTYFTTAERELLFAHTTLGISASHVVLCVPEALTHLLPGNLAAKHFVAEQGSTFNITVDPASTYGWGRKLYHGNRVKLTLPHEEIGGDPIPETLRAKNGIPKLNWDSRIKNLSVVVPKVGMYRGRAPYEGMPPVGAHQVRVVERMPATEVPAGKLGYFIPADAPLAYFAQVEQGSE